VLLVPTLVMLFVRIRAHYDAVGRAIALHPLPARAHRTLIVPAWPRDIGEARPTAAAAEQEEAPDELRHLTAVPVATLDLAALRALAYATSLAQPVLAVHISPEEDEGRRFRHYWEEWGDHVPLEIIVSPYRALVAPLAAYLQALHDQNPGLTITVVLPELIVRRRWHQLLHQHTVGRLRRCAEAAPRDRHHDRSVSPAGITAQGVDSR